MEQYILDQCLCCLLCLIIGFSAGLLYEFPRIFRKTVKHNFYLIIVEDFLFCIVVGFFFILYSYSLSDGIIRWYYFGGAICGFLIYHATLGSIVAKRTVRIVNIIRKSAHFLRKILFSPLAKSVNFVIMFVRKLFRLPKKKKKKPKKTRKTTKTELKYTAY